MEFLGKKNLVNPCEGWFVLLIDHWNQGLIIMGQIPGNVHVNLWTRVFQVINPVD